MSNTLNNIFGKISSTMAPENDFDFADPEYGELEPWESPPYIENNVPLLTKTTKARQLRPGDRMVWTSNDGVIRPPLVVTKTLQLPNRLLVKYPDDEVSTTWTIKPETDVRIIDTAPRFNEWGEDSL